MEACNLAHVLRRQSRENGLLASYGHPTFNRVAATWSDGKHSIGSRFLALPIEKGIAKRNLILVSYMHGLSDRPEYHSRN
jgi:hypothetical protein